MVLKYTATVINFQSRRQSLAVGQQGFVSHGDQLGCSRTARCGYEIGRGRRRPSQLGCGARLSDEIIQSEHRRPTSDDDRFLTVTQDDNGNPSPDYDILKA